VTTCDFANKNYWKMLSPRVIHIAGARRIYDLRQVRTILALTFTLVLVCSASFNSAVAADGLTDLVTQAEDEERRGDFANAAADFEKLARLGQFGAKLHWADACRNRAAAGQFEQALQDCKGALAASPRDYVGLAARGLTYLKASNFEKAIADFDVELSVVSNTSYEAAFAFYGRGLAKLKKGDSVGGNTDVAAAKSIRLDIADVFVHFGVDTAIQTGQAPPPCNGASANPAEQALALIPGCLPVYCAPEVDPKVKQDLKHIDDWSNCRL
jgi:tetratricopeptide (TPR) repeat protein